MLFLPTALLGDTESFDASAPSVMLYAIDIIDSPTIFASQAPLYFPDEPSTVNPPVLSDPTCPKSVNINTIACGASVRFAQSGPVGAASCHKYNLRQNG
jgi:hypothetical protein